MRVIFRFISKSPNYIKSFGVFHGLRLLFSLEGQIPDKSTIVKRYAVPGYPDGVHLRQTVSDHSIFWQCIVQRQYDFFRFPQSDRLMSAYQAALDKGTRPLIIDCGGNIGLSTLYLARLFPEARIYVIEPDKDNFELLTMNTASLGDQVVALQGGIWHESGELRIVNPESGSAAFRVAPTTGGASEAVKAYTINEICGFAGVESPLVVKIDIEGAQVNLFKTGTSWVPNTHLIMLELDDWLMPWQGTSRPFFACLSQYPFDYLISGETIFCFRDFEQRYINHCQMQADTTD